MAKEQNKDPKVEDLKKTRLDADKAEQVKGGMSSTVAKKLGEKF